MSGAQVYVFDIDGDRIRLQLEPNGGGVITADLTHKEAHWLGTQLLARVPAETGDPQ